MNQTDVHDNLVTGELKFARDRSVTVEALEEIARAWDREEPERYLHLFIRQTRYKGVLAWALGLMYRFEGADYLPYQARITDQLKRSFGNDFLGYDLRSPTKIVVHRPHCSIERPTVVFENDSLEVRVTENGTYGSDGIYVRRKGGGACIFLDPLEKEEKTEGEIPGLRINSRGYHFKLSSDGTHPYVLAK